MKTKELKEKSEKELQGLLAESREKLRDLRFKIASRQLKGVRDVRKTKKDIARISTLIKGKQGESKQPSNIK